ncbi:MAG: serine/threonine-protein phosphatase [Phycisphaerales bacterium]|nr:serine/threonine-protein phosphatase [Phycisphaerales bacterium]
MPAAPPAPHTMQCMEIWGGNRRVSTSINMPGLDAWVFSSPFADPQGEGAASDSGGDIHYLSSCATGRISRMFVADVSGHGAAVSAAAGDLRRLMGRFSNYIDQGRFVEAVNRRFGELQSQGESFAGLFATAVVATYFSPTDELTLSNAGHPRPFWFESRARRWTALDAPSHPRRTDPADLPLGVLADTVYSHRAIRLAPDDLVLIYTDPLLETRDPSGRQLGQHGLAGLLESVDPANAPAFIPSLLDAIARYAGLPPVIDGSISLDDDATLLLLRRNGQKPAPSPLLGLKATGRLIARAAGSLFRRDLIATFPELSRRAILGAISDRFTRK